MTHENSCKNGAFRTELTPCKVVCRTLVLCALLLPGMVAMAQQDAKLLPPLLLTSTPK
jgi:hypothetical protein